VSESYVDSLMTSADQITPTVGATVDPPSSKRQAGADIIWGAPFIYADSSNAFYVTLTQRQLSINKYTNYGLAPGVQPAFRRPPAVLTKYAALLPPPPQVDPAVTGNLVGIVSKDSIARFVTEDAYITRGLTAGGTIPFGDSKIGPTGRLDD
jgi:hypothetical protein